MLHYEKNLEGQNMPQVPFNTLEYAKFLIDAGMDRPLAEAQAEIQAKIISSIVNDKLATKDDIKQQNADAKLEYNELESKLSAKIDKLGDKLDNKIDEVDKRLSGQIAVLANDMNGIKNDMNGIKIDINNLKNGLKTLETKIIVKMGGIVVVALTAFSVIMKMCHF